MTKDIFNIWWYTECIKKTHSLKNLIYQKLGNVNDFLLLQTFTDISQFSTKFLVLTFRLTTVVGMPLKTVKKIR